MRKEQQGLSMIEVLVALAITAVALSTAAKAAQTLINTASRQQQVALAQMCAQNALIEASLSRQYPALGETRTECKQLNFSFKVVKRVSATANPSFRRLQAQVYADNAPLVSLITIIGRY